MKINRIFAFLLALVMTASCMPIIAVSAEESSTGMEVGDSIDIDEAEVSGASEVPIESGYAGNKYLYITRKDYASSEGIALKFNTIEGVTQYFISVSARCTNSADANKEALRLLAVKNCTVAAQSTWIHNSSTSRWTDTLQNDTKGLPITQKTSKAQYAVCITANSGATDVTVSVSLNGGEGNTLDLDNITVSYIKTAGFTFDPSKTTVDSNDLKVTKNDVAEYFTIDFEDGKLEGRDAEGTVVAWIDSHDDSKGSNTDGATKAEIVTEEAYYRISDLTASTSGELPLDEALNHGVYTLFGDFRMAYFQNTGTGRAYAEGIHAATVTMTDENGNMVGSFEISPYWENKEVNFTLTNAIEGLKLTITQNGITDTTAYKNTVDFKNLSIAMTDTFDRTVTVGGDVIDSLDMYSTASYTTVTEDEGNTYLHIGERNFTKGNDGVLINTGAPLKAETEYTIAFRARQPLNSDNFVAISVMPMEGATRVPGVRRYHSGALAGTTAEWYNARTHKDMPKGTLYNRDNLSGDTANAGYGYGVNSDGWVTYLFSFYPAKDVKSLSLSIYTAYFSNAALDEFRRLSGTNMVNPIDIDDVVIYESASVDSSKKIYENDFEDGTPIGAYQSTSAYTVTAGFNKLSLDGGSYNTIVDNSGATSMILSGFDALPAGKYQLSVDVRVGAYDGELSYEKNVASFKMKPYLINPTLNDPKATLTGGKSVQLGGEWTTVTYSFEMKEDRVLEQLVLGLEGYGEGYVEDVSRLDFRNLQIVPDNYEAPKVPFNAALLLIMRRRNDEKGDGNFLRGVIAEDKLGNWETNGQTLEVKTEGDVAYLAASNIKNNYSGFTYTSDQVLKPGTYLFRFKVRTAVEGEDTQLRITFCGNDTKLRCGNEWTEFESIIDITEETPISFRFRGGPLAFYRQNVDIADLQLFDLRDLADGGSLVIGENLFPQGDFEDPTVTYFWNGNPNEKNGWAAITVTRNSEEGNNFVTAGNRAVNHQNLDLDTGIIVEAGRTYNIRFRVRVNSGRNSGMRCAASAGGAWYKLKVGDEGSPDPNASWYNSFSVNKQWKYVDTTYVAETDGSLKIRFSGDTDAKSVQDIDIDDIEVYLMFVDN